VSADGPGVVPKAAANVHVAPNPFNAAVTISFDIGHVYGRGVQLNAPTSIAPMLAIYDIHGRMVHRAANLNTGRYFWNAAGMPAGVYPIRITTPDRTLTKRLILNR
jgi:hypothetical protein